MPTKVKSALRAHVPTPATREEAEALIADIGIKQRELARMQADMNDKLAEIKASFEQRAQPYKNHIADAVEGVRNWAEVNRQLLTHGGKSQSVSLATGDIKWRRLPPKVTLRKVEQVLLRIKELGLAQRFIRIKEEVNKDAMLEDIAAARLIPGVSIGSAGEDFSVEPYAEELSGDGNHAA